MIYCDTCNKWVGGPVECECEQCDVCDNYTPKGQYMIDADLNCLMCVDCALNLVDRMKGLE